MCKSSRSTRVEPEVLLHKGAQRWCGSTLSFTSIRAVCCSSICCPELLANLGMYLLFNVPALSWNSCWKRSDLCAEKEAETVHVTQSPVFSSHLYSTALITWLWMNPPLVNNFTALYLEYFCITEGDICASPLHSVLDPESHNAASTRSRSVWKMPFTLSEIVKNMVSLIIGFKQHRVHFYLKFCLGFFFCSWLAFISCYKNERF